jgi:DNA-binding CsgD family transcriptional regulator
MKKKQEIIAVVSHGVIRAGLKHLIKNNISNKEMIFKPSLHDCLNGKNCPEYLIVETSLLPKPFAYSLERLKLKNRHGQVLLIETTILSDSIYTFADQTLRRNDTEEIILKKLKFFFEAFENNGKTDSSETLSEREKEIVQLVALGKTNKEISEALFISPHTVITHRKNITSKLGIKTIAGLTVYAILNGIIDTEEL